MPTPHIESQKDDISRLVLMPGDPKRAEYIAKTFLRDAKLVNSVRGETAYTGNYKGHMVTVFPSGMGMGSMGIYAHELFDEYDVDVIIRIGSAGSYSKELKIFDILLAESAFSETNFDEESVNQNYNVLTSSPEINSVIIETAQNLGIKLNVGRVHTSDVFYKSNNNYLDYLNNNSCLAVEMETFALFLMAREYHKKASALLTISDEIYSKEAISSQDRETKFNLMCSLALESIIKFNKNEHTNN